MPRARRSSELPLPWTAGLQEWKQSALREVIRELSHICSGPRARPKSFCISEAIHNVVARDFNPASPLGLNLMHVLSGSVAQQLAARTDLHEPLHALLPGAAAIPVEFMLQYVNSRWWIDAFLQLDSVRCRDVVELVDAAIRAAEAEAAELQAV